MKDRFANGLVAGVIAGIVINILNFAAFYVHWSTMRYLDWAGIMIFGRIPIFFHEEIFALLVQMAFSAFVGVLFAYFFLEVTSRYYRLKGVFFGIMLWFFIYAAGIALKLPYLSVIPFKTSLMNFVGAVVYGLIAAETLRRLDRTPVSDIE